VVKTLVVLIILLSLVTGCGAGERTDTDELESLAVPKNVPTGLGITIADLSNATLDKAVRGGFKIIRVDLQWAEVEQVKGQYNWSTYDGFVSGLKVRGLRPMFILDFNNPLYNPSKDYMDAVDTPQEISGFKNFAVAAVKRYQSANPIWEIYNEPNRPQFWSNPDPLEYVNLVKATAPAMRQANPSVYIIGPALGHDPNANPDSIDKVDYVYLAKTFKAGLLNYIDAVSIHPYPDGQPEYAFGIYSKVRSLINAYAPAGKRYPIISSEWGYTTAAYISSNARVHANFWTRMYLVNMSQNVPVSIGYKLEYSTLDPSLDDYELGFPLFKANGQAKLAYTQVRAMITTLEGLSFVKRYASAKDDFLLEFSNGTKSVIAAWTTTSVHTVTIYGKPQSISGKPIYVLK
jgi:polysaccharide biosynthesis protein PslG